MYTLGTFDIRVYERHEDVTLNLVQVTIFEINLFSVKPFVQETLNEHSHMILAMIRFDSIPNCSQ